jgi:hypothetical protein
MEIYVMPVLIFVFLAVQIVVLIAKKTLLMLEMIANALKAIISKTQHVNHAQ